MDGVRITVDPEQVNKMLSEALLQSAIGEQLEKVINKEVQALSRSYDNPIEKVVKNEIREAITRIINEEYGEKIKTMVAEKVTEQFTKDLFDKLWSSYTNRY